MRKAIIIALGTAAAAGLAGCGSARSEDAGPQTERSYQVGNFQRLEAAGSYDIDVRTGAQPSVHASGAQRDLDRMVVEVRGNTLQVHPQKRGSFNFGSWHGGKVRLTVTVPSLAAAEIAGSGDVTVDKVAGESFEGHVAGSGGIRVGQVDVRQLKMGIAGSGEIEAGGGRAGNVQYEIAGSGDIRAGSVVAQTAKVDIAGSGNVAAHATQTAAVDIAGSGDVNLTGGAKCTVSKAGSGDVTCS